MFKTIREDIDAVFARDPAAKSRLEVLLCYPGIHALLFYRLSHWLWGKGLRLLARWLSQFGRFFTGIEIHPAAKIGKHFWIDHGMGVVIGETASIGDNVMLYHGVTLGGTSFADEVRHPQLGDDIIVGAGAQLLGPIHVGNGARIGSNAVVLKDVEAGATMVGIPARAIAKSKKPEFCSYCVPEKGIADPLEQKIAVLCKEVEALQARIDQLEQGETKPARKKVAAGN